MPWDDITSFFLATLTSSVTLSGVTSDLGFDRYSFQIWRGEGKVGCAIWTTK